MFLILLADYGKLLTRIIKFLWAFVRRLYYTGSCRKVRKTAPVQVLEFLRNKKFDELDFETKFFTIIPKKIKEMKDSNSMIYCVIFDL